MRSGSNPETFAEGILKVCEFYVKAPLSCVSGVSGSRLKKRIETIVAQDISSGFPRLTNGMKILLMIVGIIALSSPIVIGVLDAPQIRAQSAASVAPKFEVASIKPVKQEQCGFDPRNPPPPQSPGRLSMCTTAHGLITTAYLADVDPIQKVNIATEAPGWVNTEWYEIEAKAEGEASQNLMRGVMLRALLEERFKAQAHRVTREGPIYALTTANGGPKLQPFVEGSCSPPGSALLGTKPNCGGMSLQARGTSATLDVLGATTSQFAGSLRLDRPVVDQTGIIGTFNFHLEFALDGVTSQMGPRSPIVPSPNVGADASTGSTGITIFTALQEQLGLKLTAGKGPREYLIVDHIERPTEN